MNSPTSHHSSPHPPPTQPSIYHPLPSHPPQIVRLLSITLPPTNTPSTTPLTTHLEVYPLDSAPPYDAISYVWGTDGPDSQAQEAPAIICNGAIFPVTDNLHWALRRATEACVASPPTNNTSGLEFPVGDLDGTQGRKIYLWADAICINQLDLAERSSQVSFMGSIYACARRVFVCMGEAPTVGTERDVAGLVKTFGVDWTVGVSEDDVMGMKSGWRALSELMQRPWFGRVWVMQEVGMAREPVVLYGREEFGHWDLMGVVKWVAGRGDLAAGFGMKMLKIHLDWGVWWGEAVQGGGGEGEETFFDLIDHACLLSCRDPRDRVYAFLGHPLARRPDRRLVVEPDYSKDVDELYLEVSRVCIGMVGLRALVTVEHTEDSLADVVPSWVTKWHITGQLYNLSQLPQQVFRAGGLDEPGYRPPINGPCLKLEGFVVEKLWRCFPIYQFIDDHIPTLLSGLEGPVQEQGYPLDELLKVLKLESTPSIYGRDVNSWMMAFGMTVCATEPGVNGQWHLYGLLRLLAIERLMRLDASGQFDRSSQDALAGLTFLREMAGNCAGRSFAVTESGRYCLIPKIARPGDQICIIRRLDVPVLMRVDGPRRILLGESYVLGLMEGEAVDMADRGELAEEVFAVS